MGRAPSPARVGQAFPNDLDHGGKLVPVAGSVHHDFGFVVSVRVRFAPSRCADFEGPFPGQAQVQARVGHAMKVHWLKAFGDRCKRRLRHSRHQQVVQEQGACAGGRHSAVPFNNVGKCEQCCSRSSPQTWRRLMLQLAMRTSGGSSRSFAKPSRQITHGPERTVWLGATGREKV